MGGALLTVPSLWLGLSLGGGPLAQADDGSASADVSATVATPAVPADPQPLDPTTEPLPGDPISTAWPSSPATTPVSPSAQAGVTPVAPEPTTDPSDDDQSSADSTDQPAPAEAEPAESPAEASTDQSDPGPSQPVGAGTPGLLASVASDQADGSAVLPGQTVNYLLTWTNLTSQPADLADSLNLTGVVDDATVSGITADPGLSTDWSDGHLGVTGQVQPGQTASVGLTATVGVDGARGDSLLLGFLESTVANQTPVGIPSLPTCLANPACTVNSVASVRLQTVGFLPPGDDGGLGQTITWQILVTNTGATGLTAIALTTELPAAADYRLGTCQADDGSELADLANYDLAAGSSLTCSASSVVTQADLDAGQQANSAAGLEAIALTDDPSSPGLTVAARASAVVRLPQNPAIQLAASWTLPTGQAAASPGDTVSYSFEATNTGNTTLVDVHLVVPGVDLAPAQWPGAADTLAPGQAMSQTGSHAVTAADVAAGVGPVLANALGSTPPCADPGCGTTVASQADLAAPLAGATDPSAPTGGQLAQPAWSGLVLQCWVLAVLVTAIRWLTTQSGKLGATRCRRPGGNHV